MSVIMRLKLRKGLAAEWTAANPVLAEGEPGAELDTGRMKFGDGALPWNSLPYTGSESGEPGPQGPPGDQGPVGDQGPIGDKGPTGDKGLTGDKGPTGDKGLTGDPGPAGTEPGPTGDKGPTGDQGPEGDKGPTGDVGPNGPIGGVETSYLYSSAIPVSTGLSKRFYLDMDIVILWCRLNVVDGDGTGTAEADVLLNGLTIYSSSPRPTVAAGDFIGATRAPDTNAPQVGNYLQVNILNTGGTAGQIRLCIHYAYIAPI